MRALTLLAMSLLLLSVAAVRAEAGAPFDPASSAGAPPAEEVVAWPASPTAPPRASALVAVVEVLGNHRTGSDIILNAAAIPPLPLPEGALAEIRQRLMNLKLFETVEVAGLDLESAPRITIAVKERWTLFPIPFVSSSSRGTSAGAFLLETNLLGRNKTIVVGGSYSSWGASGFALYRDPSVVGTKATLRASTIYAVNDRERRRDDEVITAYRDRRLELALLPGVRVTPHLNLAAGWFASRIRGTADADTAGAPPMSLGSGWMHGWVAAVEYQGADVRSYHDEGLSMAATYKQARRALGAARDVLDLTGRAQYTRALLPGQATSVSVQADLIDGGSPALDVRFLGGRAGSRGFDPQTLWADRAVTLTFEHQVPFLVRGWGIWTAVAFVDAGTASLRATAPDDERATESFLNPGAGLRLYLPRTSFPAIGFDASYSTDSGELFTSVAVGVSM